MSAISAVQRPWASFRQEPTERVDARQWDMLPLPTDCLRSASHPSKGEEVSRLRSSLLAIWSKDELSIELLTLVRRDRARLGLDATFTNVRGVADTARAAGLTGRHHGQCPEQSLQYLPPANRAG